MMKNTIISVAADSGTRLDVFISEQCQISRSQAQQLIEAGNVTVNGITELKKYKPCMGDNISVSIPEPELIKATGQDIPVEIVYEDEYLLVVNKPQGMVVHPANGNPDGTLVNALLFHCKDRLSSINGVIRPGIVHRIDKDTAGLLIVAKTDQSHTLLAEQIASHSFVRRYHAVADGIIKEDEGILSFPVGRSEKDRKKMAVNEKNGRPAITRFKVFKRYKGYTYLELTLETGRTHQIRVHLSHIGHPVTGDKVYGKQHNPFGLTGQCLLAQYIAFVHPITGKTLSFCAPLPDFFANTLNILEKRG